MSFLRRKPKVDRKRFPHDYVGPGNKWGLKSDTPCAIIGTRAGGVRIRRQDGSIFTVGRSQVQLHVEVP